MTQGTRKVGIIFLPLFCMYSSPAVRAALCELMDMASSPSESVTSLDSIRKTVESLSGPRYGRPSDRFGPPTVLFSPELALLKHDLEHLDEFVPDSMGANLAFELIENATSFSRNEGDRKVALRPILRELLGNSKWQMLIANRPDEGWLEETFAYPIVEIKDDLGFGGDPFLQSLIVYSKALTHEKVWSLSCQFHSATMPRTVPAVSRPVKPTGCPTHHSGEPTRRVDCHFHRFHLRRRIALDHPPFWAPCTK